jgi:mRNA interferase RelE/StbE
MVFTMKVSYKASFLRNLRSLANSGDGMFERISHLVMHDIPDAEDIWKFDVSKLHGGKNMYRLRIGDYRAGFTFDDDGGVVFLALLHRSEAYRKFP